MNDPLNSPLFRFEFVKESGVILQREMFSLAEVAAGKEIPEILPPEWLLLPRKSWNHPQEPITFKGLIAPGYDDAAEAWLDELEGAR